MNLADAPLLFDDGQHRYTIAGVNVPSVSRIIDTLEDLSAIPAGVLERKTQIGKAVHACCEFLDLDDLDEATIAPEWAPYVNAYREFLVDYDVQWESIETKDANRTHWYAGTVDRFGLIRKRGTEPWLRALVDLKTRATLPPKIGVQLAAYEGLNPKYRGASRYALQLKPSGKYHLEQFSRAADWSTFLACLTVYKFKAAHHIGNTP